MTDNLFKSEYHNHIEHICANLDIEKYDAVVCTGGDGTNYQVLNGSNFQESVMMRASSG